MAHTPKAFFRGSVPASWHDVYKVPDPGLAVVTNIVASNPETTAASVSVHVGDTALLSGVGIAPSGVLTLDVRQVLNPGELINVRGSGARAHLHISGVEVV
ncbi:hypothetical protein ACFY1P_02845 [Streptomyces sp. NPDC001407]|uniref:hypothetical protein n=1 Tax=Streptomyces sp. NPDC001407 TaxID=3364573 RepID=UPI0036B1DEB3